MTDATKTAIEALDALLDREREALIEGDFDRLVGQLDEKTALITHLNQSENADDTRLEALQGKVLRNQALLDRALEGIRSVASRMAALHHVRKSLDTYDENGRKTTIEGLRERNVEKRA